MWVYVNSPLERFLIYERPSARLASSPVGYASLEHVLYKAIVDPIMTERCYATVSSHIFLFSMLVSMSKGVLPNSRQ